MRPNGTLAYRGPSALDPGTSVIAPITGLRRPSSNRKVGPSLQLSILVANQSPAKAQACGADRAICGDCPMRPLAPRGPNRCYVSMARGPHVTHANATAGRYGAASLSQAVRAVRARGLPLRLGTYGDPAALPLATVQALCQAAPRWLAYTHQWRTHPELAPYAMASVSDGPSAAHAEALGWRVFWATPSHATAPHAWPHHWLTRRAITCPYVTHGTQCVSCGLCDGQHGSRDKRAHVTIPQH